MIVKNLVQSFVLSFQVDDETHLNMEENNENTHTYTQIMKVWFSFVGMSSSRYCHDISIMNFS